MLSMASSTRVLRTTRNIVARPQSLWRNIWRRFCRHRLALLGLLVLLVLTLGTFFGPMVYQRKINDIDFTASLQGPGLAHPLGTDDMGQDLLARILYGGRVSIAVGLTSMLIAVLLGTLVGAVAGYCGGSIDNVLMRLTDLFISLPQLPLLLWSLVDCAGCNPRGWCARHFCH